MLGRIITLFLVFAFTMSGFVKLSPMISPRIHNKMVKDFHQFYSVNPLFKHKIIESTPDTYRTIVGATEIGCAILILIAPSFLLSFVYFVLTVIMMGALYSHHKLQHKPAELLPALTLLTLLIYQLFGRQTTSARAKAD